MAEFHFTMKAAFPADDPLARWIVVLTMGLHDLVYVSDRLATQLENEAPSWENVYAARLAGSHAWEVVKAITEGRNDPQIDAFVKRLPSPAQTALSAVVAVRHDDGTSEFRGALARCRDHFMHYPDLHGKLLIRGLRAVAQEPSAVAEGRGLVTFRGDYADLVAGQLLFAIKDDDLRPLYDFVEQLTNLAIALNNFTSAAISMYLEELPDGILTAGPKPQSERDSDGA